MDPGRTSVSMLSANHDRRRRPTEHRTLDEPRLEGPHSVVLFLLQNLDVPVGHPLVADPIDKCLAHVFCKLQIIS